MSTPKSVGGKWGPIAFALAPVSSIEMLEAAAADLLVVAQSVSATAREKFVQYERAMAGEIRASLWSEYLELVRECDVLYGWYHAAKAVTVFAEHGCRTQYLDEVIDLQLVGLPEPYLD